MQGKIVVHKFGALKYVLGNGEQLCCLREMTEEVYPSFYRELASRIKHVKFQCENATGPSDYKVFECRSQIVYNASPAFASGNWCVSHDLKDWYVIHVHSHRHYKIGPLGTADNRLKYHRRAMEKAKDLARIEAEWLTTPYSRIYSHVKSAAQA